MSLFSGLWCRVEDLTYYIWQNCTASQEDHDLTQLRCCKQNTNVSCVSLVKAGTWRFLSVCSEHYKIRRRILARHAISEAKFKKLSLIDYKFEKWSEYKSWLAQFQDDFLMAEKCRVAKFEMKSEQKIWLAQFQDVLFMTEKRRVAKFEMKSEHKFGWPSFKTTFSWQKSEVTTLKVLQLPACLSHALASIR